MRPPRTARLRVEPLETRLAPAVFNIPAGDTAALVAAVNASNVNNEPDTINLAAGSTYTFTAAADAADGGSALPTVLRDAADANTLTINGNGATLLRSAAAGTPTFRLLRTGVFPDNVAVTVTGLRFVNGDAGLEDGGAILLRAGDLSLAGCTFENNRADTGGAVYATTTSTTPRFVAIADSTFTGNVTTGLDNGGAGGAVYLLGASSLDVQRSTFTGNTSFREGGAVRVQTSSGTITIADSLLANNTAGSGNGGGVFVQGPTTITNTTVRDNVSSVGGGGVWVQSGGSLVLTGSTVSGNSANQSTASGGGVFCQGPLTVVNSTVHNNRAGSGGGIAFFGSPTTPGSITHSTITDNRAFFTLANGGGVRVSGSEAFSLGHTIVAGNSFEATVSNGTGPDLSGTVNSLGYNLIQDPTGTTITGTTTGNVGGVPAGLGPLQNNGGSTATRLPLAGSPARNAGDPAFAPPPAADQRGLPRVQGGRIDIGAAEADGPATVAAVQVNGGGAQRSMVRSIVVTFSGPVTFAGGDANAAAAFTLTRLNMGGGTAGLAAAVTTNGIGQTVVTLTFTGGAATDPFTAQGGGPLSLANGVFRLDVAAGAVTGADGLPLDGDANGTAGGDYHSPLDTAGSGAGYQLGLFRLCGDATGNGVVDLSDLAAFRSTFNQTGPNPPNPAFLDAFDFDNNDVVDLNDLAYFRACFNTSVFP